MENEKPQQAKERKNKKARPQIINQMIVRERDEVIRLDIELSFIKQMKAKYPNDAATHFHPYAEDEDKLLVEYNYHLERLTYFKSLRDKMLSLTEDAVKSIKEDVEKTTPPDLKVEKESKKQE